MIPSWEHRSWRSVVTRFKIFGRKLTDAEVSAVKALADEAGCLADRIEVTTSIGEPDPDAEDEVILMLATPDTCADVELENDLASVPKGGRRAIWIWPQNGAPAELPAAAAKYSYSIISWNAEKLRAVASDGDVTCFESPMGELLPKIPVKRNLCVEVKPKSK
jgi:hypothetical protein